MNSSKRLFVALGASDLEKEAAIYMKKLKIGFAQKEIEVKWAPAQNWHITLHFLGDTPRERIPEICELLLEVGRQNSSFKLKVSDFSAFPDLQQARAVWMGVQKSQSLLDIQSAVENSLAALGFPPEEKDYWPHLTVGRLRNHKNVVDALSPVVRKKIGVLEVRELRLYESIAAIPYPIYRVLDSFTLK